MSPKFAFTKNEKFGKFTMFYHDLPKLVNEKMGFRVSKNVEYRRIDFLLLYLLYFLFFSYFLRS